MTLQPPPASYVLPVCRSAG